ncbi:hypothetical protein CW304_23690 [Bacillus sp. UFRGS-B20]|nr:hypothetical protein CW304_23690 [Bacillus sp. UFRGS-B20]
MVESEDSILSHSNQRPQPLIFSCSLLNTVYITERSAASELLFVSTDVILWTTNKNECVKKKSLRPICYDTLTLLL